MSKKPTDRSLDPFARVASIGESTDIPDTHDEDEKALRASIPQDSSTEEGFNRMMHILGKMPSKATGSVSEKSNNNGGIVGTTDDVKSNLDPFMNVTEASKSTLDDEVDKSSDLPTLDKKVDTTKSDEKPEFTDEEVLPLLDSMLTSGYVKDEFTIRNASVALRTQFFWEDQLVVEYTDSHLHKDALRATGNFYFQVYALAANLESFGGNYFSPLRQGKPEDLRKSFQDRVDFIYTLPSFLVTYLFERRLKFLSKIQFITENFERLIKVF